MSKGKHLTEDQKTQIIFLAGKGLKATEIANFVKISYSTTSKVIREFKNPSTTIIKEEPVQTVFVSDKEQQVIDSIQSGNYFNNPKPSNSDEYTTSDLFLICALLMWGAKLLYVTKAEGEKFANFYFEKNEDLWMIINKYFDNILTSQMNVFVSCYKALKRAVYRDEPPTVPIIIQTCKAYIGIYKIQS